MSMTVLFVDRDGSLLEAVARNRHLKTLVPAFQGCPVKSGQLFRIGQRIYRPLGVFLGNNVVKVTLARIPNHHALAYAISRHHPADELP
jgi:hypothetical protein